MPPLKILDEAPLPGEIAPLQDQHLVERRMVPHHIVGAGIDQHCKVCLGKAFPQPAQQRRRQEHVPDVPQLDDQDPLRSRHEHQGRATLLSRAKSASTISWTSSLNVTPYFQPSFFLALEASPSTVSTSACLWDWGATTAWSR